MKATQALDDAKLSTAHWRVWFLSAMGIFLDGFDLFIIAAALPFIKQAYTLTPSTVGLIGAAAPIGCVVGAAFFGRMTDKLGRKTMLLIDLMFFVVFAGFSALSWSPLSLIFFRFLLGIGIGADYPVSSTYITENMPKRLRGKMLVSGFGFQALGMLAGVGLGLLIVLFYPHTNVWRYMLGIAVIPAIIILWARMRLPESPRWLISKGQHEKASKVAATITGVKVKVDPSAHQVSSSFLDLFSTRHIKTTALTAIAWFLMDIALYGVALFTPIILASMAFSSKHGFISQQVSSLEGTAFIDIFYVVGIICAIFLVEKLGRIKLQSIGFVGMALGLFVLAASPLVQDHALHLFLAFGGFIVLAFMVNVGPNPTTFLLPAEMFPTHLRATGHGFASACGKVGAVIGIFFLPILKAEIGIPATLIMMGIACLLGFAITAALGYETRGRSLDELEVIERGVNEAERGLITVQKDIKQLNTDIKNVESSLAKAIEEVKRKVQIDT